MDQFEEIIRKFQIEGDITEVKPLGHGTVNRTFAVTCGGEHYVLQEMNRSVFKYPTEVMNNLFLVTDYLRDVIEQEGRDPDLETLHFIRTKSGNQLLQTEQGSYFRLYRMIWFGEAMKKPSTPEAAYEMGRIVGQFHRRLRDFPTRKLSYPIPTLHDMGKLLRSFAEAVRADICFHAGDCQEQIHFVLNRSEQTQLIRIAQEEKEIPLRVAHNDPHYKNILVDPATGKAICLIDLDTVMPGVSIVDFGDAVRIGAATATEEEKSGDIELDLSLFQGMLRGYAEEMGRVLTEREWELIVYAVWLATLERGVWYLTDYLNGTSGSADFSDEQEALFRAVNQFYLTLDIEAKRDEMNAIAEEIRKRH